MLTLRFLVLAAALLSGAGALAAQDCRDRSKLPASGSAVEDGKYFDRGLTPLPDPDERSLKDLTPPYPDTADKKHLLDPAKTDCLTNSQVRDLLKETRRRRLTQALKALEIYHAGYLARKGADPKAKGWSPQEAKAVGDLLRTGADLLPPAVLSGYQDLLKADAYGPVALPTLKPSAEWDRGGYFAEADLRRFYAGVGGIFAPGRVAPDAAKTGPWLGADPVLRQTYDLLIDAGAYLDPETKTYKPYPKEVKDLLRTMAFYADPDDARTALRVIGTKHPLIQLTSADLPPGASGLTFPKKDEKTGLETNTIYINPGIVLRLANPAADEARLDKLTMTLPDAKKALAFGAYAAFTQAYGDDQAQLAARRKFQAAIAGLPEDKRKEAIELFEKGGEEYQLRDSPDFYKELLGFVPQLGALRRTNPSSPTFKNGMIVTGFGDSSRFAFTPEEQAGTLLHELLHIDNHAKGRGASVFVDELNSRLAQNRFYFNVAAATRKTARDFLSPAHRSTFELWRTQPERYQQEVARLVVGSDAYRGEEGAVTPASLKNRTEALLRLPPKEFDEARRKNFERAVNGYVGPMIEEVRALYDSHVIGDDGLKRGLARIEDLRQKLLKDAPDAARYRQELRDTLAKLPRDDQLLKDLSTQDLLWHQRYVLSSSGR